MAYTDAHVNQIYWYSENMILKVWDAFLTKTDRNFLVRNDAGFSRLTSLFSAPDSLILGAQTHAIVLSNDGLPVKIGTRVLMIVNAIQTSGKSVTGFNEFSFLKDWLNAYNRQPGIEKLSKIKVLFPFNADGNHWNLASLEVDITADETETATAHLTLIEPLHKKRTGASYPLLSVALSEAFGTTSVAILETNQQINEGTAKAPEAVSCGVICANNGMHLFVSEETLASASEYPAYASAARLEHLNLVNNLVFFAKQRDGDGPTDIKGDVAPFTTTPDKTTSEEDIIDPAIKAAVALLREALRKAGRTDLADSPTITITETLGKLKLSPATDSGASPTPSAPVTPVLSSALDSFTTAAIADSELQFQTHYDDSSDEEDDCTLLTKEALATELRKLLPAAKAKFSKYEENVSFLLFALGLMVLRSSVVKPYYQHLKSTHLKLSPAEFNGFKRSVVGAFRELDPKNTTLVDAFIKKGWPLFLKQFRIKAKAHNIKGQEILKAALMETFKILPSSAKPAEREIIINALIEKIILPKRTTIDFGKLEFTEALNITDYQLAAITLFLHRVTHRSFKNGRNEEKTIELTACGIDGCGVDKIDFSTSNLDSKKNRIEYFRGFRGNHPSILDPGAAKEAIGKEYKGHCASIVKYTRDSTSLRSDQTFANDMYLFSHPDPTNALRISSDSSYLKFLGHLYYLLQQVEAGRNPATLIINVMLLQLIIHRGRTWSEIFPANEMQQSLSPKKDHPHPTLVHPMSFKGAPDAAVSLNAKFNPLMPFQLQYVYDKRTNEYAHVIAKKQTAIVKAWCAAFTEKTAGEPTLFVCFVLCNKTKLMSLYDAIQ